MSKPILALRDALQDLPGGHRDLIKAYQNDSEESVASSACMEYRYDALMFVERAIFNRNSLVINLPESIFSKRISSDPEKQLVYRCAMAEYGSSAFWKEGVDLEALVDNARGKPGEGTERAKAKLKRLLNSYKNLQQRLVERNGEWLRKSFERGWPSNGDEGFGDRKTLSNIERVHELYPHVFSEREYRMFVNRTLAELDAIDQKMAEGRLAPGPDAFKWLVIPADEGGVGGVRGRENLLWDLDLWLCGKADPRLGMPPVIKLVSMLEEAFRSEGYSESAIDHFSTTTVRWFQKCQQILPFNDLVAASCKGAVIYNVVVSSIYGPSYAVDNCYMEDMRGTAISETPRKPDVSGILRRGKGAAIIRRLLPGGVTDVVGRPINLNELPDAGGKLIYVIGRNIMRQGHALPDSADEGVSLARATASEVNGDTYITTKMAADAGRHLGIYGIDGRMVLVDLGSANGTLVQRSDGEEIHLGYGDGKTPSVDAMRGDTIYLGESVFEIL